MRVSDLRSVIDKSKQSFKATSGFRLSVMPQLGHASPRFGHQDRFNLMATAAAYCLEAWIGNAVAGSVAYEGYVSQRR